MDGFSTAKQPARKNEQSNRVTEDRRSDEKVLTSGTGVVVASTGDGDENSEGLDIHSGAMPEELLLHGAGCYPVDGALYSAPHGIRVGCSERSDTHGGCSHHSRRDHSVLAP